MGLSNRNGPPDDGRELDFANDNDYMRIGEVAEKFGVTLRALRFYEDRGLLAPRRDGPVRLYARRDVARLKFVLLGRRVGLSLREVKQLIDMYDPDGPNTRQLRFALEKGERQMKRLTRQRDEIVGAIAELETLLDGIRQRMSAGARSSA
ncbi:MAG: MerR family DNA-binding transcriptional regulator [Rhizobiaceae bacterium]